mmetsp:Transcript_38447/g.92671  ORF Transcript_38447/g.92671 Transcript_38447/m.92671 type:complete len:197 (+) Transcript_38447:37-627(+)
MKEITTENMSLYFDDISSTKSSSCRERKYSEEQLSKHDTVIGSLAHPVKHLTDSLETKEAELQVKVAEIGAKDAELKIKDRAEVDLESKVLDLMIENAELKNQVIDGDEVATVHDTSSARQRKDQRKPTTSNDCSSLQCGAIVRGQICKNNAITVDFCVSPKATRIDKLPPAPRKPRRLTKLNEDLWGRSLFTSLK